MPDMDSIVGPGGPDQQPATTSLSNSSPNKKRHASASVTSPPVKIHDMSPEMTLIEFISTSAAFHGVKKQSMEELEWDILKVFPNNVMPANAAAWYMAKRRYYVGENNEYELLPMMLKHYPKKFSVVGNTIEFLETYSKDVARKKLHQLVRQGLLAYFSHKADEYGVYFFDPLYYENTEPFHTNLREVTELSKDHRSRLVPAYFSKYPGVFEFKTHSPYLVSITKETGLDVLSDTTGIVVAMLDNQYGIIQFMVNGTTEKAFFNAKSLFKDGNPYKGDPMHLPTIEFDGYRIPGMTGTQRCRHASSAPSGSKECTWFASLVWAGRKPTPKYCATRDDLVRSPYFQCITEAVMSEPASSGVHGHEEQQHLRLKHGEILVEGCMKVGEVLMIKTDGAVVSQGKDTTEEAFIVGWSNKNKKVAGTFLTTTQGVELALNDVIAYYVDPSAEAVGEHETIGCNVMVLKHADNKLNASRLNNSDSDSNKKSTRRKGKNKKSESEVENKQDKSKKESKRRSPKSKSESKSESDDGDRSRRRRTPGVSYAKFLLEGDVEASDAYDSGEDPSFVPRLYHDPELDYDEYSEGEISEHEVTGLGKDIKEIDPEELSKKLAEMELEERKAKEEAKAKKVDTEVVEDDATKTNKPEVVTDEPETSAVPAETSNEEGQKSEELQAEK